MTHHDSTVMKIRIKGGADASTGFGVVPRREGLTIRRLMRWVEHGVVLFTSLVVLFIATPVSSMIYQGLDREGELQPAKYIICLGGNSNRVIESARLLQENWAPTLIVSNHGSFGDSMRKIAEDWGADSRRIVVDRDSWTTRDHPEAVQKAGGIDIANDVCIVVTSYTHMARAKACFEKAGYRHIIMREPRFERVARASDRSDSKTRFLYFPQLVYEGAAWIEYWFRGVV